MPVRLDRVPAPAARPARPRILLWLSLLVLFLALGIGLTFVFATQALREQPMSFWGLALGMPLLGWAILGFGRIALYIGQQSVADGWDEAREDDLIGRIRQGRRSQQVLAVSLYTALHSPQDQPATQLDALLSATQVLKAQPDPVGEAPLRHTRLHGGAEEEPEDVLLRVLTQVLTDLGQTLTQVPDDRPLALLLEVDSGLPDGLLSRVWQLAWQESGIRQSTVAVDGCGLAAVDHWLDQRINDQALLLVLAVRFAPPEPEGSTEVAVGLLLGNRLTQTTLAPIAYLHRPEPERKPTGADLLYAARQALDWVPLEGQSIEQVWRVCMGAQRTVAMASVLLEIPIPVEPPRGVCNLDALLGDPGKAAPWLAIAAAAQTIERGAGPQFIFSGDDEAAGLWCTVLTPVSPLSK
ncbi:hypothetical protein IMF27_23875 [Pseudomonas sp. PCH199]|uniref:hypothetical protein n=1 Tax=unclassified Pseudomonas TaxID=196821 RepID=UPI000BDCB941|nr:MULTISPECIES: hypothetical protein [unclassified Pseudomonas]MCW8278236.1 hypothetical protein [Pseudomonas sp. PCH199]PAM81541.1 hypothetical protein CES87_24365 [Pseudomonas sp. ERMR1:02]